MLFTPRLNPEDMRGLLARTRADTLSGAQLVGEREVTVHEHPTTEIDVGTGTKLARWHFIAVDGVLHMHAAIAATESGLADWLGETRFTAKPSPMQHTGDALASLAPLRSRPRHVNPTPRELYSPPRSSTPRRYSAPSTRALPSLRHDRPVHVRAYTRKDGTRVREHTRSR